jgi:RNA polymerase sigma-70 factor (ECF subfamily)
LRLGPGLRGRVDPDEIVQETWIRALRDLEQFDAARGSFRAWIFGLAKYVLLDALRLARREDRDEGRMTLSTAALANHPDSVTSATRRLAREEGLQRFLERMQALGEDEQTLVLLCGLEGMSCDQAALRLGISHAAAVKRWQRLRAEILRRDLPRELLVEEAP